VRFGKQLQRTREYVAVVRMALAHQKVEFHGETLELPLPDGPGKVLKLTIRPAQERIPIYLAVLGPKNVALAGEIADGLLTPSITTPDYVRWTLGNVREAGRDPETIDIGCTVIASIHESDRDAGRDGAREIGGMYLANKFQNIKGAADALLESAEIEMDELAPVAEAMERGGRLAAKEQVSDTLLDRCKPIAGTPEECIAAIEEYREAGCTHVMLELWGADRHEQIRLFGERVLPELR